MLALILASAGRSVAEPLPAKHAQIELVSQNAAIKAGAETDVMLGVHFVLEPGWHIYWLNPGDSGQPPVFKWQLPDGITAGEIRWPRPERLQSSPQIVDYGYHDDVLLMVPIHVARTLSGSPAQIALDAKWLICREVCLADRAQLHLSLPINSSSQTVDPATAGVFANAKKLLPKPAPVGWTMSAQSGGDSLVLLVHAGRPISKAEFFPLEPGQIDNAAEQNLEPTARGAKITLKKSDLLLKPIASLRGVLVVAHGDAYQVQAPVTKR